MKAIKKIFSNRQTPLRVESISKLMLFGNNIEKEKQWAQFLRKNQFDSDIPKFRFIIESISSFLSPLVLAIEKGMKPPSKWNFKNAWANKNV